MSRKPKNHYLAKILGVFLRQETKQNNNNNKKQNKTKQNKTKQTNKKTPKFSKVGNLSKKVENIP